MKPSLNFQQTIQRAQQAQRACRVKEAEQLYRQALVLKPRNVDVITELGALLFQSGQTAAALAEFRRAVEIEPDSLPASNNLGLVLQTSGQFDQAIEIYRKAIQRHPRVAELPYNLGVALHAAGRLDEAAAAFEQALAIRPDYPDAFNYLAAVYIGKGDLDRAIVIYRRLLAVAPNFALGHNNLGEALRKQGHLEEAIASYRRAISLDNRLAEAPYNLGIALRSAGRAEEAIEADRLALSIRPNYPEAWNNLGNALRDLHDPDQAIEACREAIELRPNYAAPLNNIGNALRELGRSEEAGEYYRRALALTPNDAEFHSNLLFSLYYLTDDPDQILREGRRWDEQHAQLLAPRVASHTNDRDPNRPLRVGYVSGDFRNHAVGRNLLPLITRHDRAAVEAYCYSSSGVVDSITQKFQTAAVWREIQSLDDSAVAEIIRADQIDILVDLAGHSAGNRLLVFARKPAPLQVTFGGYPGGTGLQAMDYHMTDPYLDPPGRTEGHYVEQLLRLPDSFWCYDPESMGVLDGPEPGPLPALSASHVTFGCLNNFCKVTPRTLRLWASVLDRVPGSRILLLTPPGSARQWVIRELSQHRVEFVPHQAQRQYLQTYQRIDIGLDTLPYNGHTTSLDSIWMGVPIVTRVGVTAVGRAGWSQSSNLNAPDWAAASDEEFVSLAVRKAGDLPALVETRSNLRRRMLDSPLTDVPRFARNIESAYRDIWRKHCRVGV